jgi:hypothetical protein
VFNIQTEFEFLLKTLELFGLPEDYMTGHGHWATWSKESAEGKDKKKGKKKDVKKKNFAKLANKLGLAKEEVKRPTHFDLAPFQKSLKKFLSCNAEERSKIRTIFAEKETQVRNVFKDSHGEKSFKKVMDVHEMYGCLLEASINIDPEIGQSLGSLLMCFGDIEVEKGWGDRLPVDTEEQRKAKVLLKITLEERVKVAEEKMKKAQTGLYKPATEDEAEKHAADMKEEDIRIENLQKIAKPKATIKVMLHETSIHDFLVALDRSAEYDRMLAHLQMITFDTWTNEDKALKKLNRPYIQEFVELPNLEV